MSDPERQIKLIKRGIVESVPEGDIKKKITKSVETGKPLRVKLGVDPTAPDIHLGFTVVMRKLAQFQELGHSVVLIIGDYTATVGDPSGRNKTRPQITHEEVLTNAEHYQKQFFKIVDKEKTEVVYNGDWFGKMNFRDILKLTSSMTVAQMLEREDFQNRYRDGTPICIHEFLYPLMQGWDSVVVKSDFEIGGTDQKFNVLVGRDLQKAEGQEPQAGLFMPILLGTCGEKKMSKSIGNYVGIDEPPQVMYHKIFNIPDSILFDWYELLTDITPENLSAMRKDVEKGSLNYPDAKSRLAKDIISQYYSEVEAEKAEQTEKAIHAGKTAGENIPEFKHGGSPVKIIDLLCDCGLTASRGEAKRLIKNNGVSMDDKKISDPALTINPTDGLIIKAGKRNFIRIRTI